VTAREALQLESQRFEPAGVILHRQLEAPRPLSGAGASSARLSS
jgi:hypothetical protein